jgi:hypothetical protein
MSHRHQGHCCNLRDRSCSIIVVGAFISAASHACVGRRRKQTKHCRPYPWLIHWLHVRGKGAESEHVCARRVLVQTWLCPHSVLASASPLWIWMTDMRSYHGGIKWIRWDTPCMPTFSEDHRPPIAIQQTYMGSASIVSPQHIGWQPIGCLHATYTIGCSNTLPSNSSTFGATDSRP